MAEIKGWPRGSGGSKAYRVRKLLDANPKAKREEIQSLYMAECGGYVSLWLVGKVKNWGQAYSQWRLPVRQQKPQ